jgi:two-component system sensor histidine kinase/response regulator
MSDGAAPDGAALLLVDDRPENLLALEAVLAPLGRRMLQARSGEEALRHLLTDDVAVIVLDVQMPGLDGFETAEEIKQRERTADIPIIFLTAISQDLAHRLRGYGTGAVDYIFKPVEPEVLRAKVSVFLELHLKTRQLREQAEQLAHKSADLERSNRDLEQFAYIASHDLQDPLRVVAGFVELLRDRVAGEDDPKLTEWMDQVAATVGRMSALITDLLAYARAGADAAPPEPVDLDAALATALDHLRPAIEEAGASMRCSQLGTAQGRPRELMQVLQNVVGNAVKFRRADVAPSVEIASSKVGATITVTVRDNGRGISPGDAERAFQVFERLDGEPYPGTGLGLAVCRKLLERAGQRIWMEPNEGPGVTVRFTLPAAVS